MDVGERVLSLSVAGARAAVLSPELSGDYFCCSERYPLETPSGCTPIFYSIPSTRRVDAFALFIARVLFCCRPVGSILRNIGDPSGAEIADLVGDSAAEMDFRPCSNIMFVRFFVDR